MSQSKIRSWWEAWLNILIGFGINFVANLIILPLFGYNITISDNIVIGIIYTVISLVRSYCVRRYMNKND